MTDLDKNDPWYWAGKSNRNYLTPEDIATAIDNAGDSFMELALIASTVLEAIANKSCEDVSACAWVATHHGE